MGKQWPTLWVEDIVCSNGRPLAGVLAHRLYLANRGDNKKIVAGLQAKSVIGRVLSGVNQTESGDDVDLIFSYDAFIRRIILSPEFNGTTNRLLREVGRLAVAAYRS